ncbi:FxsA family protein [Phyllobacterium zundukense]|uniref:Membrane protein FxsA n=1 Tax=Phyllobacterium zundukense TaxID=1867719 RepID=A0A2N9VWJ3_9HYPH|nr:FxsA family protein [Phyllobacterium zundukense]ATU93435.1 membrane protein FxsA [Phyllobacterium zundukense]PIO43861.1 membrane protein FxsA [Phyllobacterium zundukense]
MRSSLVPLLLLALPFLEIAGFIVVGSKIGVLATLGLIFLSIFLGVFLLRLQGFGLIQKIREETAAGRTPKRELVHGVMLVFAAFLLIIPGFITDIIGLLLFIPAVRDIGWRFISDRVVVVQSGGRGASRPGTSRIKDRVIELDPEDYTSKPDPDSPWNPKP